MLFTIYSPRPSWPNKSNRRPPKKVIPGALAAILDALSAATRLLRLPYPSFEVAETRVWTSADDRTLYRSVPLLFSALLFSCTITPPPPPQTPLLLQLLYPPFLSSMFLVKRLLTTIFTQMPQLTKVRARYICAVAWATGTSTSLLLNQLSSFSLHFLVRLKQPSPNSMNPYTVFFTWESTLPSSPQSHSAKLDVEWTKVVEKSGGSEVQLVVELCDAATAQIRLMDGAPNKRDLGRDSSRRDSWSPEANSA